MPLPPFQTFLEDHAADVRRFLRAALGPVDADDCFQETFLAALRAYPRLRADSNLRAWVFTIAHRKVLDHHRQRRRGALPVAEPPDVAVDDGAPRDDGLWRAVRALPPKQRGAVLHRYVADLAYRDIAEVLGCTEAAARQNVRAGLATLRASGAVAEARR